MKALDPSAPTPEEEKEQAVTKLRYMTFREELSSTCEFGFRVEAMKVSVLFLPVLLKQCVNY